MLHKINQNETYLGLNLPDVYDAISNIFSQFPCQNRNCMITGFAVYFRRSYFVRGETLIFKISEIFSFIIKSRLSFEVQRKRFGTKSILILCCKQVMFIITNCHLKNDICLILWNNFNVRNLSQYAYITHLNWMLDL